MNRVGRTTLEMVGRVVSFDDARPDSDAGQLVSAARLKEVQGQMLEVAAVQREGLIDVRTGAAEKRRLRREMLAGPIAHLVEVGRLASREHPELVEKLRYKPSRHNYQAHRTAARSMYDEAVANKEVLGPFGLSDAVMEVYGVLLEQFDGAVTLTSEGRAKHTGATQHLRALGLEARRIVRAMDARNRHRFKSDPQALAEWVSASTIFARRAGPGSAGSANSADSESEAGDRTPEAGGDVRPAA